MKGDVNIIPISDKLNLSSYLAFVANVNVETINAALGENNEDKVLDIGYQLAMYAKYKNSTINIDTQFPNLIRCAKLSDISGVASQEALADPNILALLNSSTYYNNNYSVASFVDALKLDAGIISDASTVAELITVDANINAILNSKAAIQRMINSTTTPAYPMYAFYQEPLVVNKFDVYDVVGTQTVTIPNDVESVMAVVIGGGHRGGYKAYSDGSCGGYRVFALDTSVNKSITLTVGSGGYSSVNDRITINGESSTIVLDGITYTAPSSIGRDLYGDNVNHYLCGLSGGGQSDGWNRDGGGGGGYGGGGGIRGTSGNGNADTPGWGGQGGYGGGDGGPGYSTGSNNILTAGGTGTHYYGSNGGGLGGDAGGGSGCIVLYYAR